MKIVIVGNHAAGLSAAETLRRGDEDCEITVISREDTPPYSRCLIPYLVSGEKTVDDILCRPKSFYESNWIKALLGIEAEKVLVKEKAVLLSDGRKVEYDALIIATGGTPSFPRIPGIKNKGVVGFRTLEDADRVSGYCEVADTVVVLGGGLVGLKAAVALRHRGKKVKVIVASPNVLSQIISSHEAAIFEESLEALGIEVLRKTDAAKVLGKEWVEGIETTEGKKIECQMVIAAKGVRANKEILKGTDIAAEYGIIVDEHCRTSVPDIYAAGDVTQSQDDVRKQKWMNTLWPQAAEEGRVAAETILGRDSALRPRTSMNSFKIGDVTLISCGLAAAREEVEGSEETIIKGPGKREHRRFVFQDNRLVGYALVGNVVHAGVLTSLVTRGIEVGKVKDKILAGKFDFESMFPLIRENRNKFQEPEYEEVFSFLA